VAVTCHNVVQEKIAAAYALMRIVQEETIGVVVEAVLEFNDNIYNFMEPPGVRSYKMLLVSQYALQFGLP